MKAPVYGVPRVESGVPIPSGRGRASAMASTYAAMKVGDSFEVEVAEGMKIRQALSHWRRRTKSRFKFTSRTKNGRMRFWRIK